jgi:hypothetical protein
MLLRILTYNILDGGLGRENYSDPVIAEFDMSATQV